jgi:casein kinase II subunit beta
MVGSLTTKSSRVMLTNLRLIGAFFGTTFAHLFFQTYRELAPAPFWKPPSNEASSTSPGRSPRSASGSSASDGSPFVNPNPHGGQKRAAGQVYTPRIYGFKVSERAKSGPRMRWMRLRPESPSALDQVDWRGRWIDADDEYDDDDVDDVEEEEEDRQMEDFDPVGSDVLNRVVVSYGWITGCGRRGRRRRGGRRRGGGSSS